MKLTTNLCWIVVLIILPFQVSFAQFNIPEVPSFQTSVYDYAKVLSDSEKKALEEKLLRYSDSTTTQIVVITIEDLKGENIGLLAPKWGQEWGIGGSQEQDNGVVILLSKNDRRIHISPGYGVEDRLTAGITGELIRNIILPEFKAGSYYRGLDKGADAIFDVLKGKYKGKRKNDKGGIPVIFILLFIVILFIIISKGSKNNRNGGSGRFSGPDLADIIILSSLGRGGGGSFGGGSSGGGGFGGGFGGGGFSGGGAGGSW
ncbi:TPM domain-containing protein [Flavobacterium piscinae]|uniref:TPM domain-containing protein n=1 Tax=Flavobacterium piscinae TaxID=2506424 RepID=A0A4Q1KR90_9FLAO|nr:TPM domain-containing protein [Flavobacterium piscinae]RXR31474.1 TPM domain-containing protein [Flavobacterium piscinae]